MLLHRSVFRHFFFYYYYSGFPGLLSRFGDKLLGIGVSFIPQTGLQP